jgi:membrane peptidoglycan carboxypeptidase
MRRALSPILVNSVRNGKGDVIANFKHRSAAGAGPAIAYVMTNMMEGVINNGLGYTAVRLRGFTPPAAGKTGSSHDGWFAGYTSNLLCIVWVGYDDYSDLRLSGAMTAAPIWAEFMKKAALLPQYADMKGFSQPTGVVDVQLDKATNRLATPTCPDDYVVRLRRRHGAPRNLRPAGRRGSGPGNMSMPYLLRSSGVILIIPEAFFGGRTRSVAGVANSTRAASRLAGV